MCLNNEELNQSFRTLIISVFSDRKENIGLIIEISDLTIAHILNSLYVDKRATKQNYKLAVNLRFLFNQFSKYFNINKKTFLQEYVQLIFDNNAIQLLFEQ